MGLLAKIFGDQQLTVKALDDQIEKLAQKRGEVAAQIEAAEAEVPAELVLNGASRSVKIASNLKLELDGIDRTMILLRQERARAQADSDAAALRDAWTSARERGADAVKAMTEVQNAVKTLVECMTTAHEVGVQFMNALPRGPEFRDGPHVNLAGLVRNRIFMLSGGRFPTATDVTLDPWDLKQKGRADLVEQMEEFVACALKPAAEVPNLTPDVSPVTQSGEQPNE